MLALSSRWRAWTGALHEDNADKLEALPDRLVPGAIVLSSALGLYFEMVMIRWHATSAHVFAIFKNVSMLSCFLGLAIGFALARQKRAMSLIGFLPLLAVQIVLFGLIATTIGGQKLNPVAEQLIMGLKSDGWSWLHPIVGNAFLAGIFVLNAVMFIPVGYTTGRLMTRRPALAAYGLNLLGSLAGIVLFFLLSWIWSPPTVWIAGVLLLACPLLWASPRSTGFVLTCLTLGFLTLGAMGRSDRRAYYSPYQVISLRLPRETAESAIPIVQVNHSFYQDILDCRPESIARFPDLSLSADYYNLPYRVKGEAGAVLVVGAGTGNDVAAALRNGAESVTAVEIDPAIQYLGYALHPERPYQNPRTKAVLSDARTYLRQTDARFDTIVYGLLDSHTNLGSMTNVRLDSFVYTVEAFREAVGRLTDKGLLVVSYLAMDGSQANKLYAMLSQAYPDKPPRVVKSLKGWTFMTGPGLQAADLSALQVTDVSAEIGAKAVGVDVATDDWPFFYMQERVYPVTYAGMILLLLGLSVAMVRRHVGALGLTTPRNATFFFLGAGFMLVETKVITELGLTFGNTWAVIGIAISGVLVMAYLANLWVTRRGPMNLATAFASLGIALLAGFALSRTGFALPAAKLFTPIILVAPLFFAGLIFSSLLSRGGLGDALAANLFGSILGGFLEYNSMYWGLSSLYPLGMALYALAMGAHLLDRYRTQAPPVPEIETLRRAA